MDQLDQKLRGAGRGPDHTYMLQTLRLVVTREKDRPGYVYVDDEGQATLLAAADPEIAQNLLWEALASSHGDTLVNCTPPLTTGRWTSGLQLVSILGKRGTLRFAARKTRAIFGQVTFFEPTTDHRSPSGLSPN